MPSFPVEGFVNFPQMFVGYMSIDLRRCDIGVAEERLHRAKICPVFEKIGGERIV